MTDPVVTDIEVAAIPTAIAALKAVQQFFVDLGPIGPGMLVTIEPAKLKLLGALGLMLPGLAVAESGALEGIVNTATSGWISKLQTIATQATNTAPASAGVSSKVS